MPETRTAYMSLLSDASCQSSCQIEMSTTKPGVLPGELLLAVDECHGESARPGGARGTCTPGNPGPPESLPSDRTPAPGQPASHKAALYQKQQ